MRVHGIGLARTVNGAPIQREEAGQEAPVTLKVIVRHALSKAEIEAQARLADEVLKEVLAEEEAGGEDEPV